MKSGLRRRVLIRLDKADWQTCAEISRAIGEPSHRVLGALRSLQGDGLVEHDAQRPAEWYLLLEAALVLAIMREHTA